MIKLHHFRILSHYLTFSTLELLAGQIHPFITRNFVYIKQLKSIFSFEDLKNISETTDEGVVIASVGYYNKYKVGVRLQGGGWGIK